MIGRTQFFASTLVIAALFYSSIACAAPASTARSAQRATTAPRKAPAPKPAPKAPAAQPAPDFSGLWARDDPDGRFMPPVSGMGPVQDDPAHRVEGREEGTDAGPMPYIGDAKSPILKPWAAAVLKQKGEIALSGADESSTYGRCLPAGVPLVAASSFTMQIVQAAKSRKLVFLYEDDAQSRRIYLGDAHSARAKPSWYGESIAHYEGDTLVVDTIGQNQKTSVDRYGTPHTEALRVVERYRLIDGGARLENTFTVDDPKTFTAPWSAIVHWKRAGGAFSENVCAQNPRTDGKISAPEVDRPEF